MMSVISVSHLSKYYNVYKKEAGLLGSIKSFVARKYETVKAVDDISFEIEEGELVGFIGPNGAGKTTTLKCLSGLLYPTPASPSEAGRASGELAVLGFNPSKRADDFLKRIALVMGQKNQLWWDLPALETLLLNKEIYDVSEEKFNEVIFELSRILEIGDLLKIPVRKLSLGERMKCELIAALIHSPKVLFLDEPTIGLDVVMQKKLREFIKEYNRRYKATIILTSHYMADVEALCKRIIIINFGKILFDGELLELVKKYAPYKIVRIVFKDYIDPKKIENLGQVKKFSYPEVILKVSDKNSSHVVSKILKNLPVEDLIIENPEIEDVIREVFSKKRI